jgi:hypothetical protein
LKDLFVFIHISHASSLKNQSPDSPCEQCGCRCSRIADEGPAYGLKLEINESWWQSAAVDVFGSQVEVRHVVWIKQNLEVMAERR